MSALAAPLRAALLGLVASSLALAWPAVARGEDADTARLLAEAQALVNRAAESFKAGELESALADLQRAEGLAERAEDPSLPNIRFNIARVLEQLGRDEAALEAYERYDALPDASHRKQKAFAAMQALQRKVFAVLSVACAPAGAVVEIEGLVDGMHPCPWQYDRVPPGRYTVAVSAPGYTPKTTEVEVAAGDARSVQVNLQPDALSDPAGAVRASRDEGGVPVLPVAVLGAGAAVAGVGGVFTALAVERRDEAEALAPGATREDAVSSFETFRALSYVLYGVGGALAAVGGGLFFVPGGEDDPEAARLVPGPTGFTVRF
jgi:tetratricopeptide (TPR) repeat protein